MELVQTRCGDMLISKIPDKTNAQRVIPHPDDSVHVMLANGKEVLVKFHINGLVEIYGINGLLTFRGVAGNCVHLAVHDMVGLEALAPQN